MTQPLKSGLTEITETITDTYFSLRWGMVALAVAFPLLLWLGDWLIFAECKFWPPRSSMSAYYRSEMRDWFVGILFAVAACLYLYKGLSNRENLFLNGAGVFAVGIAINPLDWHPAWLPAWLTPHGFSAITFFALIVLDCWLCQNDSINLGLLPKARATEFRKRYRVATIGLVGFPLLALVINTGLLGGTPGSSLFWVEAAAIWTFAFYWHAKSGEIAEATRAHGDRMLAAAAASAQ